MRVTVEEPDVLRRVTLLNVVVLRMLTGTRLVKLVSADYGSGCVEVIYEGAAIQPDPAPGQAHIEFLRDGSA